MDRVMPGTGTVQEPSQAEPRSAMLRQVMKQGLERLARLDGLIESRPWFAPASDRGCRFSRHRTSGRVRICVWRHDSSGLGQAFFRSVVGGKFVSAVAVGHELGPGEPDILFLWPRFLLHHQFVLPGPSLSRIRVAASRTFCSAGFSGVGSGRVCLASAKHVPVAPHASPQCCTPGCPTTCASIMWSVLRLPSTGVSSGCP